jgi:hypothetical protein
VLRTGREIIDIDRRARASAEKRGKGEELSGMDDSVVAREEVAEDSEDEDPANGTTKQSVANSEA